jgi:response regulator of citrate/malate metabolism
LKSNLNNLLIVEDNFFIGDNIFSAAKGVSSIGGIRLTETLQEAITVFNESNFEIVILDLKLPDGNGIELLRMINEKKLDTKVFVFSISTELKKTCLKYGAFAFFDKAKDFDELIEAIKTV